MSTVLEATSSARDIRIDAAGLGVVGSYAVPGSQERASVTEHVGTLHRYEHPANVEDIPHAVNDDSNMKLTAAVATASETLPYTVVENRASASPKTGTGARYAYRFIKRTFDIVFSLFVIVFGFLPALILSIFIIKDTGGSPIYLSERIGKNGRPFKILKFRSMVADSDDLEKHFTPEQMEQWHREHKVDDDPRITKLGDCLRRTSIDEFPQFVNVLLGQMSVIGPRAITEDELEYFGSDRELLLSCPVGITGLWQTSERNLATYESGLRQDIELLYVKHACLRMDAQIFLRTFKAMIERTGK